MNNKKKLIRTKEENVEQLYKQLLHGNRAALAKAITLVESNAERHFTQSQHILQNVMDRTGNSIRIGISGVPGAGKSTFIEAFGLYLCSIGKKVAVLAVDPSSSKSGGSILGDKTRMEELAKHPQAFIRPSPSGGTLGGVNRKTRESILLCEAAGYDVILVETVGVGQSEGIVRDMVDFFLLLVLTGAGDELQGMKKGIMELIDLILVNKADGENLRNANRTAREYNQILHFLQPATPGWQTKAKTCSALNGTGIMEAWEVITQFVQNTKDSHQFVKRRSEQKQQWFFASLKDELERRFFQHSTIKTQLPIVKEKLDQENMTVSTAVKELLDQYDKREE